MYTGETENMDLFSTVPQMSRPTASLLRDNTAPHLTTYGSMNDWMGVQDRVISSSVPVPVSDSSWLKSNALSEPRPQLNDKYNKAYNELSQQIAYRYPNPGKTRERQGRSGGSWRHIKEVLGHGGSRVVFVDGIVGLYDSRGFTDQLCEQQLSRPHLEADGFIPAKYENVNLTTQSYPEYDPLNTKRLPSVPDATPRCAYPDEDVNRKMALLAEDKYKGFYKYK